MESQIESQIYPNTVENQYQQGETPTLAMWIEYLKAIQSKARGKGFKDLDVVVHVGSFTVNGTYYMSDAEMQEARMKLMFTRLKDARNSGLSPEEVEAVLREAE